MISFEVNASNFGGWWSSTTHGRLCESADFLQRGVMWKAFKVNASNFGRVV